MTRYSDQLSGFLAALEASGNALSQEIEAIVRMHQLEHPDEFTMRSMLTAIGHAVLRSSGEDRPLTVSVAFA